METCRFCKSESVAELIDFGMQPICNRFLSAPDAEEEVFALRIGQCGACGLVQSAASAPASELRPRYDWITYSEPEGHLDRLAGVIAGLPDLRKDASIAGISFKDDSLMRRLRDEHGFLHAGRLDMGATEPGAGVETIQERLTPEEARGIARSRGKAAVVIARHIWEHAGDPAGFIEALKELIVPGGYVVLEVPDCERALGTCDYSTVWEEHTLYFTSVTFGHALSLSGLSPAYYECCPYTLENSLIAVARPGEEAAPLPEAMLEAEVARGRLYAGGLEASRDRFGNYLAAYRKERGRIALLGAGHLACTYINLLGLKEHIDCLLDDNPHKRGQYMPGSRLPILGSSALLDREIKLCLLSVNAEIEDRVIEKNRAFTEAGGEFHSIFPASKHALPI